VTQPILERGEVDAFGAYVARWGAILEVVNHTRRACAR